MEDEEEARLIEEKSNETTCNPVKYVLPDTLERYWKTVLLASFLFVSGLAFLISAVVIVTLPDEKNGPHSYVFFLCGAICVIPGGYHLFYIINSYYEKEGYDMINIPTFEGEN